MLGESVFYTISEQIVHQIKSEIFSGKLKEGEALKEVPMAEKYRVSRGSVRDAFKVLAKEGFLIARPNIGVEVAPPPSDAVIQEVILLRRHIELFALENAFDHFTEEDIEKMEYALRMMEETCSSSETQKFLNYDMGFHSVIVKRYDDRHLYGIWNEMVFRMMFNYNRLTNLKESCEEHLAILKALKNKNLEEAKDLLRSNIQ